MSIQPTERSKELKKCLEECKTAHQIDDGRVTGIMSSLSSDGRARKRAYSECKATCQQAAGGITEFEAGIDDLQSTLHQQNMNAQAGAVEQIADCAKKYDEFYKLLAQEHDIFLVAMSGIFGETDVYQMFTDARESATQPGRKSGAGSALGGHSYIPATGNNTARHSAGWNPPTAATRATTQGASPRGGDEENKDRATYFSFMKAYDNPNDESRLKTTYVNYNDGQNAEDPLRTMSQLKVEGSLKTTKPNNGSGCTGTYWNFESIVSNPPASARNIYLTDGRFNPSAELAERLNLRQYPYMFLGCIGALTRQVEALIDNFAEVSSGNAILQLDSNAEPPDGEQSAYVKITESITGIGASQYGDASVPDASTTNNMNRDAGDNVPRGASVGILTHGAPLYWPTNFTERDSTALNSAEGTLDLKNAAANFSLVAWAERVKEMTGQWIRWVNGINENLGSPTTAAATERDNKQNAFVTALLAYCDKLVHIAPQMQANAKCIFDADRAADNVINANDETLAAAGPDRSFRGNLANPWRSAETAADQAQYVENARFRARNVADSGTGILDALPEKLFFKEQCFLLSYIGIFSDWKKYYLDRANVRQNANDAIISGVATKGHKKLPYYKVSNLAMKPGPAISNACLLLDGDPYGFMNKLTACPYTSRLNDIENWELSNIQPRIRLFKVVYDTNGAEKEIEIAFDSHFSRMDKTFMIDKASRGAGVGLKTFNFTYDGSNPFAAKKSIKAKLVIFANTFQELLRERQGKSLDKIENDEKVFAREPYKYIELALKTAAPYKAKECKPNQDYLDMIQENEEMAKLNFRLKAVVGLSAPAGLNGFKTSDAEVIQRALNDSYVTLNLTPTTHDFDLDEQGRVTFTVNYLAYVDDFFDQNGYNIFADPSGKQGYKRIVRNLQMKTYQRDCSGADSVSTTESPAAEGEEEKKPPTAAEHLANIKEEFAKEVQKDQLTSVSSLVDSMACANVIYYVNVPYKEVRQFLNEGPFMNYNKYITSYKAKTFIQDNAGQSTHITTEVQDAMSKIEQAKKQKGETLPDITFEKNQIASALANINPNENNVAFFYVSDLIDIILVNIQQELTELPSRLAEAMANGQIRDTTKCDINQKIRELQLYAKNFKRMRILLGPVEVLHQKPAESMMSTFVNFGDLPISLKYFLEWLTSAVLKRDESHYPLAKFLNDFFNTLIRNFLNNDACFAYNIAQNVRVNQAVVTSYATDDEDDITAAIKSKLPAGQARINISDFKMPQTCATTNTGFVDIDDCDLPILNVSGAPGGSALSYAPLSSEINYFVYFAGRTMPTEKQNGIRCHDEDAGIQHYLLGRNKGLVKNIKLSKTDSPGLAEVRFEQDGFDGLRQLRNVYDVQVDTFASVQSFPGNYIYISPQGFDPSVAVDSDGFDLTDMGIGGYCMIVRSEHEFGEGFANSTIHAKWVASVDNAANQENESQTDNPNQNAAKCGIYAYRHGATK